MGSGGLQFDTYDSVSFDRLKQKTRTIGTGTYLSNVTDKYAGEGFYSVDTSSNFIINKCYNVMADGVTIAPKQTSTGSITETDEQSQTLGLQQSGTLINSNRWYNFCTLPTTEVFYIITGIQFKFSNDGTTRHIICGVDAVDAIPPVLNSTPLLALSNEVTVGASTTIKLTRIASRLIRGGTNIGVWVQSDDTFNALTFSAQSSGTGYRKAIPFTTSPKFSNNTAWTSSSSSNQNPVWIVVYYRGYS